MSRTEVTEEVRERVLAVERDQVAENRMTVDVYAFIQTRLREAHESVATTALAGVLTIHEPDMADHTGEWFTDPYPFAPQLYVSVGCGNCTEGGVDGVDRITGGPCSTLRTIAAAWADHPDYREEWRP
jgi:hypothetical protein